MSYTNHYRLKFRNEVYSTTKEQLCLMSENEELARYQKLLDDWKPGGAGPKTAQRRPSQPSRPSFNPDPAPARQAAAAVSNPTVSAAGSPSQLALPGTILLINERTLAIYQRAVPEKEYHLVLILTPNGSIKIQGIALQAHQMEEIGNIPPQFLEQMQTTMRWDRDLVVFHCYSYDDVKRLPPSGFAADMEPAPAQETNSVRNSAPTPPEASAANQPFRRGQRVNIKFGNNAWDAVYWGRDGQNHVVAHKTYQKWSLMHLDLDRFGAGLVVDTNIDESIVAEIEKSLLED